MVLLKKKYIYSNIDKIYWYSLKDLSAVVLKTKFNKISYGLLPANVLFFKRACTYKLRLRKSNLFFSLILKWFESFYKLKQKKLFFKGLGFKFKYLGNRKICLELKLGFSHFLTILIPRKEIRIFLIKKNRLAIDGFTSYLVGNFARKVKGLRFPDSYNGKGFWYKNEFKTLKQIKKS